MEKVKRECFGLVSKLNALPSLLGITLVILLDAVEDFVNVPICNLLCLVMTFCNHSN